jgi:hypothetical protein
MADDLAGGSGGGGSEEPIEDERLSGSKYKGVSPRQSGNYAAEIIAYGKKCAAALRRRPAARLGGRLA